MSDKESALRLLREEHENLSRAIDGLDDEQLSRVWFGIWAVRDIIAHIAGWQRETAGLLRRLAAGERVDPDGSPIDADERNAAFVREMAPLSPDEALAAWRGAHADYVEAANAVPDGSFGEGRAASRLLERTAIEDFRRHAADILEWRRREGI